MTKKNGQLIPGIATAMAAVIAGAALFWWLTLPIPHDLTQRVPDEANRARATAASAVNIEGTFEKFEAKPSDSTAYWPHFRGADHSNVVTSTVSLADSWPADGPPVQWELQLGEGYSAPCVANGCLYLLDYDEEKNQDSLRCFSLDDASELWRRSYKVKVKRNHGISRTQTATDARSVISFGPKCHVLCVDAKSGAFKWAIDLPKDYGSKVPLWYAGQCPLIVDGKVLLAPAGTDTMMMAVDCATGDISWKAPNPNGWKMSHSSIIPMTFHGQKMFVYFAIGGAVGVSPEGKILWTSKEWKHNVIAPSPLQISDNQLLITSGYGGGSMTLQIDKSGDSFSAKSVATYKKTEFACEQQTPILYDNHLFTLMPNDAAEMRKRMVCMSPTGEVKWFSGTENRFGLGPFLFADQKIFILSDDGVLTMAKADTEKYVELAVHDVLDGHDAWGPMVLFDGRLLVRDLRTMKCLDLRKK